MPRILTVAGSDLAHLIPLDGRDMHALTNLLATLDGPPDLLGLETVVPNANRCIQEFLAESGVTLQGLYDYAKSLDGICLAIVQSGMVIQPFAVAGRAILYKQWTLLHRVSDQWQPQILAGIGAELVRAHLLRQLFAPARAHQILRLHRDFGRTKDADALARKSIKDTMTIIEAMPLTGTRDLKINSLILTSISSQFNPLRIESRQAAGSMAELSEAELTGATVMLKELALGGDITSLQLIVCYHMGLPWDLGLDISFSNYAKGDWVAQIDICAGLSKIDLSTCLPGLAKGKRGHIPASPILVRPLPSFAAKILLNILASTPHAQCLRDLNDERIRSTDLIPHIKRPVSDRLTIAKFIASRGTHGIRCGLDRASAAYVTADFTKIGKSNNYYLTFTPVEIWEGSARVFNSLGWGDPVPMPVVPTLAMGSCVTPDEATIMAIDRALQDHLSVCKSGKKYTIGSIGKHTNAFAMFCAYRTAFASLSRGAEAYSFFASDYLPGRSYALLVDKRVGPHDGQTPIPFPTSLQAQIRLWLAHLEIYDARLSKLGIPPSSPVRTRIRRVLAGERVPLYFHVNPQHQVMEVGSANIKAVLPDHLQIKADFGRHYLQNKLRMPTISQSWIDGATRHHVDGTSMTSASANVRQIGWLTIVAKQIDEISLSLQFSPVVGLGRGRTA